MLQQTRGPPMQRVRDPSMAGWRIGSYVVSGWNAGLHQDEESGLWKARVPNTRTMGGYHRSRAEFATKEEAESEPASEE